MKLLCGGSGQKHYGSLMVIKIPDSCTLKHPSDAEGNISQNYMMQMGDAALGNIKYVILLLTSTRHFSLQKSPTTLRK